MIALCACRVFTSMSKCMAVPTLCLLCENFENCQQAYRNRIKNQMKLYEDICRWPGKGDYILPIKATVVVDLQEYKSKLKQSKYQSVAFVRASEDTSSTNFAPSNPKQTVPNICTTSDSVDVNSNINGSASSSIGSLKRCANSVQPLEDSCSQPKLSKLTPKSQGGSALDSSKQIAPDDHSIRDQVGTSFLELADAIDLLMRKYKTNANPLTIIHEAADKPKQRMVVINKIITLGTSTHPKFQGVLMINDIVVAEGEGKNKKAAKYQAYYNAIANLTKEHFQFVTIGPGRCELQSSDKPFAPVYKDCNGPAASKSGGPGPSAVTPVLSLQRNTIPGKGIGNPAKASLAFSSPESKKCGNSQKPVNHKTPGTLQQQCKSSSQARQPFSDFYDAGLDQIILVQHLNSNQNPMYMLRESAHFNKIDLVFETGPVGCSDNWCKLWLNDYLIAEAVGRSLQSVKTLAAEKAWQRLQEECWTIRVKQPADTTEASLSKEELLGMVDVPMQSIPEDNKGSMLLRKMGWSGGGMGKMESGITEPVAVSQVINRAGLGLESHMGVNRNFAAMAAEVLEEYARSDRQDDLVFSSEFKKEERVIIHSHCRRLGLKSKSHGKKHSRCLVVCRRRNSSQLLQHLLQHGGSTSKYDLIPPGENLVSVEV